MTAAVIAAIAIAVYPVVAAVYLAVSSQLISWDLEIDVTRVLRSRTPGGSGVAGQRPDPPGARSAVAGVERGGSQPAAAPPAPCPLVVAVGRQTAAPARPPRVAVHG